MCITPGSVCPHTGNSSQAMEKRTERRRKRERKIVGGPHLSNDEAIYSLGKFMNGNIRKILESIHRF